MTMLFNSPLRMAVGAIGVLIVALAFAASAGAGSASARTLNEARSICPDGTICLFQDVNFGGKYVSMRYAIDELSDFAFNDQASSYINDSSRSMCLYDNDEQGGIFNTGGRIEVGHWAYDAWLGDNGWENRISSGIRKSPDWAIVHC